MKADGIIYADLAIGTPEDGKKWGENGFYKIKSVGKNLLKDYYISETTYSGKFGDNKVLTATGTGTERFYVMALKDFESEKSRWSASSVSFGMPSDFGMGKDNTNYLMNNPVSDLWKRLKDKISDTKWFVPSQHEWSAFAGEIGITKDNYKEYGLESMYWSSSKPYDYKKKVYRIEFSPIEFNGQADYYSYSYVRLSTTF